MDDFDDDSFVDDGMNDSSVGYQSSVSIGLARRGDYGDDDLEDEELDLDDDVNIDDF